MPWRPRSWAEDSKAAAWGASGAHAERGRRLLAKLESTARRLAETLWPANNDRPTDNDILFIATVLYAHLNGSIACAHRSGEGRGRD